MGDEEDRMKWKLLFVDKGLQSTAWVKAIKYESIPMNHFIINYYEEKRVTHCLAESVTFIRTIYVRNNRRRRNPF